MVFRCHAAAQEVEQNILCRLIVSGLDVNMSKGKHERSGTWGKHIHGVGKKTLTNQYEHGLVA